MKYVIYHGNCADGLTAASLHQILVPSTKESVCYLEGSYSKTLEDYPDFTDSEVLFLDFSFKEEEFKNLLKVAKDVQVIDHHITANEYLSKIIKEDNVFSNYVFDNNECGSTLTWKTFSNDPIPIPVLYIKDQDIYVWEYPEFSKPFCLYIETVERTLESFLTFWKSIISNPLKVINIVEQGEVLLTLKANYVSQMTKHYKMINYLGYDIAVCNCPNLFVNDVSDYFRDNDVPYFIGYTLGVTGISFSLRSAEGYTTIPITLSISAKGGGHACASGAFLSYEDFEKHPLKQLIMG